MIDFLILPHLCLINFLKSSNVTNNSRCSSTSYFEIGKTEFFFFKYTSMFKDKSNMNKHNEEKKIQSHHFYHNYIMIL